MYIGDLTSIGLMSSAYQPNKENWVDAQYRKVGAGDVKTDIFGARSIVERCVAPSGRRACSGWLQRLHEAKHASRPFA